MFNKNQLLAINSNSEKILILAGAGTGKTKVIIHRIERLVNEGVNPADIVVTTFTNKASIEIKHRLEQFIGEKAKFIISGTFHKVSSFYLKKFGSLIGLKENFQILVDDDQRQIIKQIIKELNLEETPKFIIEEISKVKESKIINNNLVFKKIFNLYQEKLKENNFLDYSDLIKNATELFKHDLELNQKLCKYLLVDEYQDVNLAQYEWIKALASNKNLLCVGDEDQAIYGFRGSDIKYIQSFKTDYPNSEIIFLNDNYRSVKEILTGAVNVIAKNDKKFPKELISNLKESGKINITTAYNEFEEASCVSLKIKEWQLKNPNFSIGVLVRTNTQINYLEHSFLEHGIQYELQSGRKFYEKKEIKDLIYYLRIVNSDSDYLAFTHIINVPKRGMGDVKLNQLLDAIKSLNTTFENALNIFIPQMPKLTAQKCNLFLMQLKIWRSMQNELLDVLINKILLDTNYKELEKTTVKQNESIKNFIEYAKQYKTISELLENFHFNNQEVEGSNLVQVMTMHAAKGLEFDVVITPGWEEEIFPSALSKTYAEIQEERRLAYVTITRAKYYLEIIKCKYRKIYGQFKTQMPSRFIFEL